MTWEEAQEECSWCGDQTVVTLVDPLALCHECLKRYKEKYPNEQIPAGGDRGPDMQSLAQNHKG